MTRRPGKVVSALAVVVVGAAAFWARGTASSRGQVREVVITGDQFAFSPTRIEVQKDDLVQVKFTAKDVAHSFTIDVPYRISKRAGAGPVSRLRVSRRRGRPVSLLLQPHAG